MVGESERGICVQDMMHAELKAVFREHVHSVNSGHTLIVFNHKLLTVV